MGFLASGWLLALPLAAAPVVFHLIMRRRRRAVVLPSLMFLHLVDPRHRARRRLRELAVLALRALAVAAAILALARPTVAGIGGGPAAVAIVVDNSASTALPAAADAQRSVLDLANAGAGALIAALAPGDAVAVLPAVPDPAVPAAALDRNRDAARRALDAVRPTDAAARPAAILRRAAVVLGGSGAARRELHLFTDAQAGDWGVAAAGAELPAGTTVTVHRIDAKVPAAAAVLTRCDGPGRLPVGRPLVVRAALANPGSDPAPVTVQAVDDAGRTVAMPATVPAGGAADIALVLPGADAGIRAVRLRIDGAPGPGAAGCVIAAVEAPRSVLCLGGRAALGALAPALDPSGDGALSGLKAASVPPEALGPALAANGGPLLACAAWNATPDALARLAAWAEAGGAVVLVPPPDGSGGPPGWSGCEPAGAIADKAGTAVIAADPGDPLLRDLVGPDGSVDLGNAHVRQAVALKPVAGAHAVLATADGRAVLVAAARGKGRVATFGFPWFRSHTDLPARAQALALAQGLALPVAPEPPAQALVAGEAPRLALAPDAQVRLIAPGGAEAWKGRLGEMPPPPRAGAWSVLPPAGQPLRLAVRADPAEGDARACANGTLPALAAFHPLVRSLREPTSAAEAWRGARSGADLAPWLVLLIALALAAEAWLSNPRAETRVDGKAAAA